MKKRLLPFLVIALLILAGWYLWAGSQPSTPVAHGGTPSAAASPSATSDDYSMGTKFTGAITQDECLNRIPDTGCYIVVDSKKVTVDHGNARPQRPWGAMSNIPTGSSPVGKSVEVYAHKLDASNYTLEGSTAFYVDVTN